MSSNRVLCLKRSDVKNSDQVILINLRGRGPQELNFDLLGTEGENPYAGTVKHNALDKLQAKGFKGSSDEWQAIIAWTFFNHSPQDKYPDIIKGVELVAALAGDSRITITIRQNISGITQILGNVTLERDDDREIELFDWTGIAVQNIMAAEQKTRDMQAELKTQNNVIKKMKSQMQEFLKVKEEHENQMLERFSHLLNAKKLKIRDQQRLLAGATIDENAINQVKTSRSNKAASGTRKSKRKAQPVEDESEDDFETGIGRGKPGVKRGITDDHVTDEELPGGGSPHRTDDEDTEDDEEFAVTTKGNIVAQHRGASQVTPVTEIPQPRQLPFNVKQQNTPTQPAEGNNDDDDEETDDEL